MSKRRDGTASRWLAAAVGISLSSAHRVDESRLQPKAAKLHGRRRPNLVGRGLGSSATPAAETPTDPNTHHPDGPLAGAKASSGLEFTESHRAATDAGLKVPPWPSSRGVGSAVLPAQRDRLLRHDQGQTSVDHPAGRTDVAPAVPLPPGQDHNEEGQVLEDDGGGS